MPKVPSLADPGVTDEIVARLEKLHEKRPRAWGRMSAHEMLCHLADSLEGVMGERTISSVETWWNRTIVKYIALHTTLAWPRGLKTRPEVDPFVAGTKPTDFARDRAKVIALLRRFASAEARYGKHPIFGPLTREEWLVWGYRHTDHHLRQFAL